jgi:hypothetical protein
METDTQKGQFPSEREADQSPLSGAEVKNAWRYTSTPQYVFIASCLVKQRVKSFVWLGICDVGEV